MVAQYSSSNFFSTNWYASDDFPASQVSRVCVCVCVGGVTGYDCQCFSAVRYVDCEGKVGRNSSGTGEPQLEPTSATNGTGHSTRTPVGLHTPTFATPNLTRWCGQSYLLVVTVEQWVQVVLSPLMTAVEVYPNIPTQDVGTRAHNGCLPCASIVCTHTLRGRGGMFRGRTNC
jgi:hypothetical protein